jgi:hypothetical protein
MADTNVGGWLAAANTAMEETPQEHSVHELLDRAIGNKIEKVITLDANNTTASVNIFQVTGTAHIYRLYAEVVDATTLVNCTAASFDLWDSTAAVQITAASGVLSGVAEESYVLKTGLAANAFAVNDATAGALSEQTYEGSDVISRFIITQKNGADTFIRFTYTTTDAPINAQLKVYCEYRCLDGGNCVAV